jgi:NADH:ubiquinone oxidoreductase subunit E
VSSCADASIALNASMIVDLRWNMHSPVLKAMRDLTFYRRASHYVTKPAGAQTVRCCPAMSCPGNGIERQPAGDL